MTKLVYIIALGIACAIGAAVAEEAQPSAGGCSLSLAGNTASYVIAAPVRRFPLTSFTVALWVRTDDTVRDAGLVSYATHQADNHFLIYDMRNLRVFLNNKPVSTGVQLADGKWHYLVVTWQSDAGRLTVYKDGVQAFQANDIAKGWKIEQRGSLVLGNEQDRFAGGFSNSQSFRGNVRDFRIYNVVHDLDWVKTALDSKKVDKRFLVIHWPLKDCSKRYAIDPRPAGEVGLIKPRGPGYPRSWSRCHLQLGGHRRSYASIKSVKGIEGHKVSVMFWMRTNDRRRYGTPFSYSLPKQDNAFTLYNYQNVHLLLNGQVFRTGVALNDGRWHHVAMTWNSENGYLRLYVDGIRRFHSANVQKGWKLPAGGAMVVGQEQDKLHGGFNTHQAFRGKINDFRFYNGVVGPWGIRRAQTGRRVWQKANLLRFRFTSCRIDVEHNIGTNGQDMRMRGAIRQRPRCVNFGTWKPRGTVAFSERDPVSIAKTVGRKSMRMLPFGDLMLNYSPKTGLYTALRVLKRHKMSYPELVSDYFEPFRSGWKVVPLQGDYVFLSERKTGRYELYPFSNQGFDRKTAYGYMPRGIRRGWSMIPLDGTRMLLWHRRSGAWRMYQYDRFVHGREPFFKRLLSQGKWCDIQRNEQILPIGNGRVLIINAKMGSYRLFALGSRNSLGLFSSLLAQGTLESPFMTHNTRFVGLHGAKVYAYLPRKSSSLYTTFDIGFSSKGRSQAIDAIGDDIVRSFKSVKASLRKAIQANRAEGEGRSILNPRAGRRSLGGLSRGAFRRLVTKYLKGKVPLRRLRRFASKWQNKSPIPLDLPSDGIGRFSRPQVKKATPVDTTGVFQDVIDPTASKIDYGDAANYEKSGRQVQYPPDTVVIKANNDNAGSPF
eukprot:TRINITY_DN1522_c0_g1_i1.p1 TRINITY_DN1522_c0_g1~~TRINITY_DN1522_c0_g1_i1.p1  ORF type:complete len:882 (+),score=222.32 TRINITY_DN1522_c0_g1_i1:228-2873(+)